jgi:heterokaryon incompatibility protein (HET)
LVYLVCLTNISLKVNLLSAISQCNIDAQFFLSYSRFALPMRLLERNSSGGFSLTEFVDDQIPRYAILSHTWGLENDEVSFKNIMEGTGNSKAGYKKIMFCGERAGMDGLQYFWVDTCCIDKSSSQEITEAINCMFQWYQNAAKCYVFLKDVSVSGGIENNEGSQAQWESEFRSSRWFTRGWTLQELLAP